MKRKLLILFLAIISAFTCAFAFSACEGNDNGTSKGGVSVAGKTFIFDRVETICENDEMKEYVEGMKANTEESMKDDYITFKIDGNYDYVISGLVQNGTYTQSDNAVKISLQGEVIDFTATENSLSQTFVENGVTVTLVYVKGTPSNPVTPTEPTSCKHNILIEIEDYKQASCAEEGYSLDVWVCTNTVDNKGFGLICGMIFSTDEKETEPIGQLPNNFRDKYYYDDLAKSTKVKKYLLKYGTTFEKLPHTPVTDPAVPATCCTKGLTEGSHCEVCDEIFKAQVVTDYSDHDYSDVITYSGAKGSDKVCTGCGKLENKEYTFKTKLNDDRQSYTLVKADGWVELDLGSEFKFNDKPVTVIGGEAFNKCETLKSADLTGVESIGDYAFWDCTSFTSVILGNNLKKIGEYAFGKCAFKSLEIPKSVEYIGTAAFNLCDNLEIIGIPLVNGGIQGTTAGKSEYFDYLFTFEGFGGKIGRVPETLETVVITSGDKIGYQIFEHCSGLKSIIIPDGVTCIDMGAFIGCRGLKSITIPDSVLSIKYNAFAYCSSLTSITIPNSVTSIGRNAFIGCYNLMSATIGKGVTEICDDAFDECYKLVEIYNLSSLNITKGSYDNGGVAENALNVYTSTSEESKLNVTEDGYTFYKDEQTTYLIGYQGKETDLTLPENYEGNSYLVYSYAFYNSDSLKSIVIPDGITLIVDNMFSGCSNLTSISLPNSVTSIGSNAFENCSSLTSINIPDDVTYIGNSAFSGCSGLTSIIIPDGVTSIDYWVFSGCSGLTSVTIPSSVTFIDNGAFRDCSSLTSIAIPSSVKAIGNWVFDGCSKLSYNEFEGAYYLGNRNNPYLVLVRAKNQSITDCTINKNAKFILGSAFENCSKLTCINIPDSITEIGDSAFDKCSSLTIITIPDSVTFIGSYVISDCTSLTDISFGSTIAKWKAISKSYNWNSDAGEYTVHCSDGDIAKADDK